MISKKAKYVLLFVIAILIGTFVFKFLQNDSKSNANELSKVDGVLIYSDYDAYISAYNNEPVRVQLPVYEFNNSLDKGWSVSVDNFTIGEISKLDLSLKNKSEFFNLYVLSFEFVPKQIGRFTLDDIGVEIISNNKAFKDVFGHFVFDIVELKENENLMIIGGSLFEPWPPPAPEITQHRTLLLNATSNDIELNSYVINHNNINIVTKDLKLLKSKEEYEISVDMNIVKTPGNVFVRPMLIYSIDSVNYQLPLNLTTYGSNVPEEELLELAKVKGLLEQQE